MPTMFAATLKRYPITEVRRFCEKKDRAAGSTGTQVIEFGFERSTSIPGMKLKSQSLLHPVFDGHSCNVDHEISVMTRIELCYGNFSLFNCLCSGYQSEPPHQNDLVRSVGLGTREPRFTCYGQ